MHALVMFRALVSRQDYKKKKKKKERKQESYAVNLSVTSIVAEVRHATLQNYVL